MTPAPQKEYIITEKLLQELVYADISSGEKEDIADKIRQHTTTSAELVLNEKIGLLKTIERELFNSIYIRGMEIVVVNSLFSNHIQRLKAELRAQRGERER